MGWSRFGNVFSHGFLPNRVLKRRLFKFYFLVRKTVLGSPSVVPSLENHAFQLRTCFSAIFAACVPTGRAVVEKRLKRCLKRYSSGAVAVKTPCETYLVRKRSKQPIWTKSRRRPGGAAPRHGVVIFWQCFFHDFSPNRVLKRRLFKICFWCEKMVLGSPQRDSQP